MIPNEDIINTLFTKQQIAIVHKAMEDAVDNYISRVNKRLYEAEASNLDPSGLSAKIETGMVRAILYQERQD